MTERTAWTRRLHVLLMVSNSFPVFMLITYQGRGREFRWQDLRSIFVIPMNSSQVGISQQNLFPACITAFSGKLNWDGWLHSCWHPPPKAPALSRQVLFKVIAFRFWFNQPSAAIFTVVLSTGLTSSYTKLLPWQKSPSQTKFALAIPLTVCRNTNLFPVKDKPM